MKRNYEITIKELRDEIEYRKEQKLRTLNPSELVDECARKKAIRDEYMRQGSRRLLVAIMGLGVE